MNNDLLKGRGSQLNTHNPFLKNAYVKEHIEGIDEEEFVDRPRTEIFFESPKKVINKVLSPDIGMEYSLNPYQGCEHGCIYCYARITHEYWGFNAGLDFERKVIVKKNAAKQLEKELLHPSWKVKPIVLSGNTDCYQPLERKFGITRQLLEVFAKYRHPVGIITKNVTLLRDLDILGDLARDNLISVFLSITSLDEGIRSVLEPRTASAKKKLEAIKQLTAQGVPVGIMNAPIIPGLNHHETPAIIKAAAAHGARTAGYTIVRLNGTIAEVFKDWLAHHFPDRSDKIWHQVCEAHGGTVNDSQYGRRIKGEGQIADAIGQLFAVSKKKYMSTTNMPILDCTKFRRSGNYTLF